MKFLKCLFSIVLLATIVFACSTTPAEPTPTVSPQENAWYACKLFIENQLGIPSTDSQRYTPSGVTATENNQFKVKVYYAKLDKTYQCELLNRADGNWQLLSLEAQ